MPTLSELMAARREDLFAIALVMGGGIVALTYIAGSLMKFFRHKIRR